MYNSILVALQVYGVHGIAGALHNPIILWFFKMSSNSWVNDDETPWCAAFVNWVLKQTNRNINGSLSARSFLTYGTAISKPQFGCIVVFWRDNIAGPYGHVGFFVKEEGDSLYILGGNQSNSVNITKFPKSRVLGYRKY